MARKEPNADSSRRDALRGIRFPSHREPHRGLWLDKYIRTVREEDTDAKRDLVREVAGCGEPKEYRAFFTRYRKALEELGAEVREARTLGRLVVGLGGEGVLETSLTLHRTYGVPYIPGSALKGLASRYAHLYLEGEAWRRNLKEFKRGAAQKALFGDLEEQGALVFFDALPLPGTYALHPDVMTPHHAEYYGGGGAPPADWDSPVPVPFLSVTGTFLLALAPVPGLSPEVARPWLEAAWRILAWALKEEGVGAKTAAGYGRMELEGGGAARAPSREGAGARFSPEYEDLKIRLRGTSYRELRAFLEAHAALIQALSPEEAQDLRQAMHAKGFLNNPRDLKRWAKGREALKQALERLGL
ncbi:type III-B CRISPR module RAMP protein Cmr6 [Marinithermus hydrothermalis]|uniref:CRISPR-associated RAMP protein, Cmr6 family n=1 Tax=Marinithermus hydrothermalis (strain DSM 14884 / JCM 11576 / T1) TaxID=869210 RepID=F2NKH6_MARHT|nr:type III-B CRISPR module RAMP protein Cmr6 [Marinithermus hydrothermalis]AEB12636.1 CRISPR-associated RAMP protein, Cmr6 family [Marinithermus hydrothermalis DSM 14884]